MKYLILLLVTIQLVATTQLSQQVSEAINAEILHEPHESFYTVLRITDPQSTRGKLDLYITDNELEYLHPWLECSKYYENTILFPRGMSLHVIISIEENLVYIKQ